MEDRGESPLRETSTPVLEVKTRWLELSKSVYDWLSHAEDVSCPNRQLLISENENFSFTGSWVIIKFAVMLVILSMHETERQ